jgi:hypothetical protein
MIGDRGVNLLCNLINEKTLPGLMSQMSPGDWKHNRPRRELWNPGLLRRGPLEVPGPKEEGLAKRDCNSTT